MGRNYKKEAEWAKNKYSRFAVDIEKELGEKFKTKVRKQGKSITEVLRAFIKNYANE